MKKGATKAKMLAMIAAMLALAILFLCFSVANTAHEHECVGKGCAVCAMISTLRELFSGMLVSAVAVILPHIGERLYACFSHLSFTFEGNTPVFLKVKISC